MIFGSLKWRGHTQSNEVGPDRKDPILPSDIRYALQYRNAQFGPEELEALTRNHFEREATYLVLKAVSQSPEVQHEILQQLVTQISQNISVDHRVALEDVVRGVVQTAVGQLPAETRVLGTKLAQISRQGFLHWHDTYRHAAERHAHSPLATFLIGHATFIGLADFISQYAQVGKPLYILIPAFIENPESSVAGYRIHRDVVEWLPKDFTRDSNAVVIDDTKNTGNSSKNISNFWGRGGIDPLPRFEFLAINEGDMVTSGK